MILPGTLYFRNAEGETFTYTRIALAEKHLNFSINQTFYTFQGLSSAGFDSDMWCRHELYTEVKS